MSEKMFDLIELVAYILNKLPEPKAMTTDNWHI